MDTVLAADDQKSLQEDTQEKRAEAPELLGAGDPAELERRRARAKRFGIKLEPQPDPKPEITTDLPDIPDGASLRPEAIHLHGTDEMSTEDVLAYFELYSPSNIEWINDSSCNVVWADSGSALRALLGLSTELPSSTEQRSPVAVTSEAASGDQAETTQQGTGMETGIDQNQELESDSAPGAGTGTGGSEEEGGDSNGTVGGAAGEEESAGGEIWSGRTEERRERSSSEDSEDLREDSVKRTRTATEETEGSDDRAHTLCWRCGQPHPKAGRLLLRLATEVDVKEKGAAKRSAYYRKYGRPVDPRQAEREGWEEGEEERWSFKRGTGRRNKTFKSKTWREGGEEEEWQEDLRVRLGKKHSLKHEKEEEEEEEGAGPEPMEVDRLPAEPSPFASLAKRPKPMHSDRPSDLLDVTEMMDESEKQRRLSKLGDKEGGGALGLGDGRGDLRRALQQRKKRRNLMLRLGHTPRLVERKN